MNVLRLDHAALLVKDIERDLKERDVEIVCGPRPRGNDGEQLYIRDPDDYMIELFARRGVDSETDS